MDFVEPIRDRKKIAQIKNQLEGAKRYRDLLLFVVGINTALRISDLLQLRIGDMLDEQGRIQARFLIREEKREKRNEVVINTSIREALEKYLAAYPGLAEAPAHYLFFSTKLSQYSYTQPITRVQAWRLISAMCQAVACLAAMELIPYAKPGGILPGKTGYRSNSSCISSIIATSA